ncbi:MAG TPA: hypothetical protein VF043_30900 [Ktedonobacteraceae bacterium]
MSDPISLRNVPPELLHLAQTLSMQMGASVAVILRLSLASGLLVEATKVAPDQAGKYAGLDGVVLAKALRRHLASAIDVLVEYGQHPYHFASSTEQPAQRLYSLQPTPPHLLQTEEQAMLDHALGDDLETLGLGMGLAETGA